MEGGINGRVILGMGVTESDGIGGMVILGMGVPEGEEEEGRASGVGSPPRVMKISTVLPASRGGNRDVHRLISLGIFHQSGGL